MQKYSPLIWITLILVSFLSWYFSHRARHKERLMMIERGNDPEEIIQSRKSKSSIWLKIGILLIGLGVGLLIISILVSFEALEKGGNALPLAILGICGGISMIVANYIANDKNKS